MRRVDSTLWCVLAALSLNTQCQKLPDILFTIRTLCQNNDCSIEAEIAEPSFFSARLHAVIGTRSEKDEGAENTKCLLIM
ncbi:Uncharacterized protein HZ326_27523 [Fusarium oxysporum f. sp. albedinis]|nr:Uncharacterized protein HZ326_27523 [Fusarium oxysporum f. sp. albedinis]